MNLGRFAVPNVFVNLELRLLANHYNSELKAICDLNGEPLVHVSKNAVMEVFGLDDMNGYEIAPKDLEDEYQRLSTTYQEWRLPLHRKRPGEEA